MSTAGCSWLWIITWTLMRVTSGLHQVCLNNKTSNIWWSCKYVNFYVWTVWYLSSMSITDTFIIEKLFSLDTNRNFCSWMAGERKLRMITKTYWRMIARSNWHLYQSVLVICIPYLCYPFPWPHIWRTRPCIIVCDRHLLVWFYVGLLTAFELCLCVFFECILMLVK